MTLALGPARFARSKGISASELVEVCIEVCDRPSKPNTLQLHRIPGLIDSGHPQIF